MAIGLAWIVAVVLGLVAGGLIFHFPGSYGEPEIGVVAGVIGFLFGALNGLLVGGVAALALRLDRSGATRLAGAMAIVIGVTHGLNDGSSTTIPFVLVQLVAGLAAAGAFAWRFAERRPVTLIVIAATWTLGIVIAAWSGDLLGLPFTETNLGWAQDHAWDGFVTGLVWATATAAIGVPELIRAWQPAPERPTAMVRPE